MKKIVLALLATSLFSVLTGCASMPEAPKNAEEKIALGEDSFLNVPVDVSGFSKSKLSIFGEEGGEGVITVFTDQHTGKTYDLDGQPINEKGERVLKDGYVCKVKLIVSGFRSYQGSGFWSSDKQLDSCLTSKWYAHANKKRAFLAGGVLIGGAAMLGALAASAADSTISSFTSDDTL